MTHTNTTTECFTVSAPTAVTLTDFSARTSDGRGVAVIGFGTLGFVLLGGLSFVFARKRQVTTLDKGRPVPEAG